MAGCVSMAGGPPDAGKTMELNTRCPDCETVFPVSLTQLQLRKGYIRCVQCAHIFDGFEAAVPAESSRPESRTDVQPTVEPRIPVSPGPAASPDERPAHQPFIIPPPEHGGISGSQPARPFSIGSAGSTPTPPSAPPVEHSISAASPPVRPGSDPAIPVVLRERSDMRARSAAAGPTFTISDPRERRPAVRSEPQAPGEHTPPAFVSTEPVGTVHDDTDQALVIEPRSARRSGRYQPDFIAGSQRRSAWLTPVWAFLALCGLLLLALQGAYIYRMQLAAGFPQLRPVLEAACARAGCTVPYERDISAIALTGSALRVSGTSGDDVSQLTLEVTLRNALERPQEWPTLVLDLNDASGTVVVRRNLGPEIWVPAELRGGPFAAGSELKVQLPLSVRGLQVNGFQLDKFFP